MPNFIGEKEIFDIKIKSTLENMEVLKKLETASRCIGEVNNIVSNVLEFDFIISALKNIEALNSARIEGTTGNLKDLYLEESLDFEKKKRLKLFSAVNYKLTMSELEDIVKGHKVVDLSLIRHLHKLLTENDPSTQGTPGSFRNVEVKIQNSKLGDFYPVHPTKMQDFTSRLVAEIDSRSAFPSLLQTGITHYQFESIHPFEDGNGRTGRLLIIAQLLIDKSLISAVLNLSQYFDTHREEYVAALRSVSDKADFTDWILFFLEAIICQTVHNIDLIKKLRSLKESNEMLINENTRSSAALHVLNHSLNELYITITSAEAFLRKKKVKGDLRQMARNNILLLKKIGILDITTYKKGRSQAYVHKQLKDMLMRP